jgi:hypothetical protein
MTKYKITFLGGKLDTSMCPPSIVYALFPKFDKWSVFLSDEECIVEVPTDDKPIDLGPLIKVETIN